ncbi:8289_t:CDS:2, partial [Gigaspora margarita]
MVFPIQNSNEMTPRTVILNRPIIKTLLRLKLHSKMTNASCWAADSWKEESAELFVISVRADLALEIKIHYLIKSKFEDRCKKKSKHGHVEVNFRLRIEIKNISKYFLIDDTRVLYLNVINV